MILVADDVNGTPTVDRSTCVDLPVESNMRTKKEDHVQVSALPGVGKNRKTRKC